MKKSDFIFSIAAILMSVFCLTSCKEGGVVEPVPEPEPEPEVITFEVTPSVESLVFEAARPETYEFAVETNDSTWEVTSDAEWCVIAQSETGFTLRHICRRAERTADVDRRERERPGSLFP